MKTNFLPAALTAAVLAGSLTIGASPAKALSLTASLEEFTGDNAGGQITLTDRGAGIVELLAEITAPTVNGDINGIWFDIAPVPGNLNITGANVNNGFTALNPGDGCANLGGGNNLNGGGNPCPLNIAVAIGSPGQAGGRITSTLLEITGNGLSVASFGDTFGLRYQSTGVNFNGSSKLGGTANDVVPTPAAVLPALFGMGVAAVRKKKDTSSEVQNT